MKNIAALCVGSISVLGENTIYVSCMYMQYMHNVEQTHARSKFVRLF